MTATGTKGRFAPAPFGRRGLGRAAPASRNASSGPTARPGWRICERACRAGLAAVVPTTRRCRERPSPRFLRPPGAPPQSRLNAFNGVFYRLVKFPFGWAHDGGDTYTASMNLVTPINRRFELEWEVPFVVSGRGPDGDRHTAFGDFAVTTRFLLSE